MLSWYTREEDDENLNRGIFSPKNRYEVFSAESVKKEKNCK